MKTRDSSFLILIVSLIALTFTALLEAKLLLNDSFSNFDNWTPRSDGSTGVIKITNSLSEENSSSQTSRKFPQMLFTNISQCVEGERCYRAMAYIKPKLRSTLIPTCHEQYWLGFSLYFPTSWGYKQGDSVDTSYHFELQSGDAREVPALLDLVVSKGKMSISVCGNTKRHSSAVCHSYALGQLVLGEWVDLVVNSQLAYGSPTGWIKVWRNNVLMVDEKNILTAYNDIMPPYLIAGSYQLNWRYYQSVGYSWLAAYYGSVRLGNSASSYGEVYTGDGSQCGDACSVESAAVTWFTSEYLWGFIPLGLVIVFSIILYLGSAKYRARQWSLPETTEEKPVTEEEAEREANDLAYNHFLGGKDPFNMTDDDKKKHQKSAWFTPISEFKASFRHTSQTRTIFWYLFAFCCVLIMLFLGILLYGIPESSLVKVRPLYGAIPVNALQNWSVMELSMAAISGTMICIYFLPLFYLQHDFEAGKQWKNDPNFLKRIGVIIPCHKSAGEIGEVLRRALKYFPPENIVVCDNGNFDWPPDNTFEVVKAMNPRIRYLYIKQGHKTRALWTGVHRLPARVEYVIHLDDDTHFDEDHMVFDEKHFEEKHVIAIAFLRSSYPTNTVTQYTDFWYKITDHFHATQAKIATRCFVPGPAGMWKRDKFMEIFGKHPSLPFGEDIFGGFTTLNNGYAIRSETRCMVKTFAPDVLVPWCINMGNARVQGYGASSLWKQRAHRWTVSALRITGKSLYSFFTYDTKLGLFSNIAFRLYRFREYKLILAQLFYLPFCLVLFARGFFLEFILLKLMLFALPLSRNFFINYVIWRNQPQLQTSLKTVLLSPFFNFFLICCAIHGRWKCILWYLPCVAPNHGMLQRTRPRAIKDVPVEDSDELLLNYQSNSQSLDPALLASQSNDESVISFATLTDIALNPHAEAAASPITASPIREDFQLEGVPDHTDVEATEVNGNTFRFRHDKYFELFDREEGRSKFVYFIPAAVRGELLRKRELMMTSNSSNDLMLMMLEEGKQRSFDAEESSIIRPRSIRRMSFGSPDSTILRTPSVSFINSAESKTTARKRSRFGFSSFSKSHSTDVDLFISPVPALSLSADSAGSITQLYLSPEIYTGENDVIVQAEAPVPIRTPIKFNEGDVIRL